MKTAIVLASVLLTSFAPASGAVQGDVYLGSVDGLINGSILVESSSSTYVEFTLNYRNNDWEKAMAISNGFEISGSDSSVTWQNLNRWLDPSIPVICFDWPWFGPPPSNGVGADTIGLSISFGPCWQGLPGDFDGPFLLISAVFADTASAGGTFCLDSAFFPPSGSWMWAFGAAGTSMPTWDGPHCYPIIGSCCFGQRGNVDFDPDDQLDITDLVYLLDYMFAGGPPLLCLEEADIDGNGAIDIADLVRLADYMFTGGIPPADCP